MFCLAELHGLKLHIILSFITSHWNVRSSFFFKGPTNTQCRMVRLHNRWRQIFNHMCHQHRRRHFSIVLQVVNALSTLGIRHTCQWHHWFSNAVLLSALSCFTGLFDYTLACPWFDFSSMWLYPNHIPRYVIVQSPACFVSQQPSPVSDYIANCNLRLQLGEAIPPWRGKAAEGENAAII